MRFDTNVHKGSSDQLFNGREPGSFFLERRCQAVFHDIRTVDPAQIVVIASAAEIEGQDPAVVHLPQAAVPNDPRYSLARSFMVNPQFSVPRRLRDGDIARPFFDLSEPGHVAPMCQEHAVEWQTDQRFRPVIGYQQTLAVSDQCIPVRPICCKTERRRP